MAVTVGVVSDGEEVASVVATSSLVVVGVLVLVAGISEVGLVLTSSAMATELNIKAPKRVIIETNALLRLRK